MKWAKFVIVVWVGMIAVAFVAAWSYEEYLMGNIGRATSQVASQAGTATQSETKP